MRTPEEMAEEYRENHDECEFARDAFLAGYKAAQDQFRSTTGGAGDKLTPTGWISVKDRLPEEGVWVLGYYRRNKDEKFVIGSVQRFVHSWAGASIWMTDIVSDALSYEEVYSITHWQPLPEAPKEKK